MTKKNETEVGLKVNDKGSLKNVGNQAKKTGKDLKGMTDKGHSADRAMKGLSRQSSNSTKNFSKMSQGLTGGLVPAYATLAANIFALGAAFRFLQQAADYKILIEGQKAYAAVTGVAYMTLTKTIQSATDGQIRYAEAAQAAAIGTAAGLNAGQLERLGNAAKLASIALGRDVTDAFNRLVRGTTKAEPELLDELGIILRLDTALEKYATLLGKSKNELTQFEKSQAITNDVLEQAESKFGAIAELLDPEVNKLNQMAKKFDDLVNSFKLFIAGPAGAIAEFFGNNIASAAGVLALLATPILTSIIPSFEEFERKADKAIGTHNANLKQATANAKAFGNATTQAQLKATTAYNKSATKLQGLAGAEAPGRAGTGLANLQAGKTLTPRQLGALKSQAARGVGIFKDMDAKIKASWLKTMEDMTRSHKKKTEKVKAGTKQLVFNYKVAGEKIKAGWARTMSAMKTAQTGMVKFANKLMGAIGWISIGFLLFDLAKQAATYFGLMGQDADIAGTAIEKLTRNQSELNDEIERMLEARKIMLESGDPAYTALAQQGGQMLLSAAGVDTMKIVEQTEEKARAIVEAEKAANRAGEQSLDRYGNKMTKEEIDGGIVPVFDPISEAFIKADAQLREAEKARMDLADRLDMIAKEGGTGFEILAGAGEHFRTGGTWKELSENQKDFVSTAIEGAMAQQALTAQGAKYQKELKANLVGTATASNKWLATTEDRLKNQEKVLKNLKAQNLETGETEKQIEKQKALVKSTTEYHEALQDILATQSQLKILSESIKRNPFAGGATGKDQQTRIKVLEKEQAILQLQEKLSYRILNRQEGMSDADARSYDEENLTLHRNIKLLMEQKRGLESQIEPLFQIQAASALAFEDGLSKAILGVIDGTKSMKEGFLDMARAVLQAIAQIIAQLIAMAAVKKVASAFGFGLPFANGGIIGMANGGIKPKGYRSGGVVTEPTYLVGEGKYNEAVVPLPDGRSIPVVMKGGGSTANVVVNVSADGQTASNMTSNGGEQAAQLAKGISAAVQEELHKQQRNGGILSPYGNPAGGG